MEENLNEQNDEKVKNPKKSFTKKIVILLWVLFLIAVPTTVALWFAMDRSEQDYEEVKVTVLSAETDKVTVKSKYGSKSTTDFYKINVDYNGKTYDLENAHDTYSFREGKTVTAYLSNGRLFANIEGVKTSTPIATVYFVFLFGSFALLFAALIYTGKLKQN